MTKENQEELNNLVRHHEAHLGLYTKIGRKLKVTPSYVSRVARGQRESEKIAATLLRELRKLE